VKYALCPNIGYQFRESLAVPVAVAEFDPFACCASSDPAAAPEAL